MVKGRHHNRSAWLRWLTAGTLLLAGFHAAAATGVAWRVDNPAGQSSYLVGSIHVGAPRMYPLPKALDKAFARADVLVVEANILDADYDMLSKLIYRLGLYHDGSNLRKHLTDEQWHALKAALQKAGVPAATVLPQKPWLAYNTLTMATITRLGYSDRLGVDRHFLEKARNRDKPIMELEGLQWQLELLAGLDEKTQIDMLMDTVNHRQRDRRALREMVDAWSNGDEATLQRLFDEGFGGTPPQLRDELIDKRNATMTERIRTMMKDGRSYFVVVGAGHLIGPKGLAARLRDGGFTVERMSAGTSDKGKGNAAKE